MSGTSSKDFKDNNGSFISKYVLKNPPSQHVKSTSVGDVKNQSLTSQNECDVNTQHTVDEVVKRITETVKKYEKTDSTRNFNKMRLNKRSSEAKEFLSFSQMCNHSTVEEYSEFSNSFDLEDNSVNNCKIDSQWNCDTQLATLVDNADAILNLFNSNEMSQCHTLQSASKSIEETFKPPENSQLKTQNDAFKMPLPVCKMPVNKTNENFSQISKLQNVDLTYSSTKPLPISQSCEFKTASQRDISISQCALQKVAKLFDNIDSVETASILQSNQSNESFKINNSVSTQNESLDFRESKNSTDVVLQQSCLNNETETLAIITSVNEQCVSNQETESQNKVVDLGDWEKFFNNTMNSSEASNEVNDYDDEDITGSPILISQKIKEKEVNKLVKDNDQNYVKNDLKINKNITDMTNLKQYNCSDEGRDVNMTKVAEKNKMNKLEIESTNKEDNYNLEFMTPLNKEVTENTDKETDTVPVQYNIKHFENPHSKKDFDGFVTVSNKKITISPNALLKAKTLFSDIDSSTSEPVTELLTNCKPSGFMTANNKSITVSEDALLKVKTIFNDLDREENLFQDDKIKQTENIDEHDIQKDYKPTFLTASNKKIIVSEEALNKAKSIFKDIQNNNQNLDVNLKNNDECIMNNQKTEFVGFMTASNKQIPISDEALSKTKSIFENIDNEINEDTRNTAMSSHQMRTMTNSNIFKTASNKDIIVSNQAIIKAKMMFEDIDVETEFKSEFIPNNNGDDSTLGTTSTFTGFKTANNRNIDISKRALERAKHLFDGLESEFKDDWITEPPNKKTKKLCEDSRSVDFEAKESNKDISDVPSFSGFSTANNVIINVSEKSMLKAKAMFEDLHENQKNFEKDLKNHTMNQKFDGFSTASNKKINISEEALKKAKSLFQDINHDVELESIAPVPINTKDANTMIQNFSGFTTASNKNINVSEVSLKNAKTIFESIENEVSDVQYKNTEREHASIKSISPKQKFDGFSTASNKKITISDAAILRAKTLFSDIENSIEEVTQESSVFVTTSDQKIIVSDEALVKTKNIFSDLGCVKMSPKNNIIKGSGGFKTASNKDIAVSEKALAKAKILFEDNLECTETETELDCPMKASSSNNLFVGFSSGRNEKITVSTEALKKAQNLFQDIVHDNRHSIEKSVNQETTLEKNIMSTEQISSEPMKKTLFSNENLTQEISESTKALLNDEDSTSIHEGSVSECDDLPLSPILPSRSRKCKKVFKVPYNNNKTEHSEMSTLVIRKIIDKIGDKDCIENIDLGNLYNEKNNRSEHKILLRNLKPNRNENNADVTNMSLDNVEQYIFKNERLDIPTNNEIITLTDLHEIFLNNSQIDGKLIPENWIMNHLKLIIWKLASYERFFGFDGVLTVGNVLKQLKYRYDKELYKAERPLMRKILECDDVPGRKMILCVRRVIKLIEEENKVERYELEVTDGWYVIRASIDSLLMSAVVGGKLVVGTKIITCGAELHNCGQGKSPLEDISDVRLQLHGNSTRIAPWHAKLGACNSPGLLRVAVDSLKARAGPVPVLCFLPIIIYPQLFVERLPTGDTITRSEKLEQMYLSSIEGDVQASVEKLYMEAENEIIKEKKIARKRVSKGKSRIEIDEEELLEMMEDASDPGEFMSSLTNTQRESITNAIDKKQTELRNKIDMRVKQMMKEKGVCSGNRKVVSILKVRGLVLEIEKRSRKVSPVMLTVWKVQEATLDLLKSMKLLNMYWASPTGTRSGELHLSTNKLTTFCEAKNQNHLNTFPEIMKYVRKCTSILDTNHHRFTPIFNEVDTVGFVFKIEPSTMTSNNQSTTKTNLQMSPNMQSVYMSDENMNIIAVHFWGGIVKFGYDKTIEVGKVVACSNLQHRPRSSRKRFRNLYATEYTTFSQCPRKKHLEEPLRILENNLKSLNIKEYMEKCKTRLMELAIVPKIHSLNSSSSSTNQSSTSLRNYSHNGVGIKRKIELDEGSLSGLDFDSSFNEPISPSIGNVGFNNISTVALNVTPDVNQRIKKLKVCEEPPLLSPVTFKVSRTLRKEFVTPKSDNSINLIDIKDSGKTNAGTVDLDKKQNEDEEDPFKENFIYSPPDLE